MTAQSKLTRHLFVVDPDLPARYDAQGRLTSPGVCAACHLPGEAGDARHTLPEGPTDDVQRRRAGDAG